MLDSYSHTLHPSSSLSSYLLWNQSKPVLFTLCRPNATNDSKVCCNHTQISPGLFNQECHSANNVQNWASKRKLSGNESEHMLGTKKTWLRTHSANVHVVKKLNISTIVAAKSEFDLIWLFIGTVISLLLYFWSFIRGVISLWSLSTTSCDSSMCLDKRRNQISVPMTYTYESLIFKYV